MKNQPVDDATARYILETRKYFEDMRQVTSQIAGVLVLAASGAKTGAKGTTAAHPMIESASELHRSAWDGLQSARPTPRARVHHECLTHAAGALAEALSAADSATERTEINPILVPLRAAYQHLQRACDTLPGFEMVAFEQGCCNL